MQSVKIVALVAMLCVFSVYQAEAQFYAPGYGYYPYAAYAAAAPWSYLHPYGRYFAYAPAAAGYVVGKRSAGFGPSETEKVPEEQPHPQ